MTKIRLIALLMGLMGMINVLSAVTPSIYDRLVILRNYSPLIVRQGGHLTAALAGFALLILARNLGRRKHVAWVLTLAALFVSIISHLVKGLDYEEALLAAGLMVVLWFMRAEFHARSDRPSIQQGLRVLAGAFLFTLGYGVSGFYLLDRHYSVNFGFWAALRQTLVMFTQFYDPGLVPMTHFGHFFAGSIYAVGAATFAYAGFMLLRPVFMHQPATSEDRLRARKIVERYGHSSLARFLLFNDKRYFFSSGGSVIGYALAGRTAVALGDPVGPREDLLPAVHAFQALCERNDWVMCFYQTLPETLESYRQAGLEAICIGNEGIVDLQNFTTLGRDAKALRAPVNKLSHAGYRFAVHKPPLPDDLVKELRSVSDEWLAAMHSSEKGFSLGWFDEEYVRNAAVGVVYTPAGQVSAFASLVPEYQADEIAVDLMRRRRETENGSMEFLFVSLFQWAKEQQYHRFNLGLSALSGVGNQADDPTVERIMRFIYEHVNQFYHFKGLHSFKEKFHPEWSPRYLIYSGRMNLAQTWLAVIQANSGQSSVFMRPAAKIKELLIRTNSVQKGLYGAPRTTPHIE